MTTISVLRQLPRNSRIISRRQAGGDRALLQHAVDRGAHEERLVEEQLDLEPSGGAAARIVGQQLLDAA